MSIKKSSGVGGAPMQPKEPKGGSAAGWQDSRPSNSDKNQSAK